MRHHSTLPCAALSVWWIVGMVHATGVVADSPWSQVSARLVRQPVAREGTVLEVIGDFAYVYGGAGDANDAVFNDTWKFDFLNQRWSQIAMDTSPGRRFDHVSTVRGSDMYIFGGTYFDPKATAPDNDGTTQMNDVWKLDSVDGSWTLVNGGGRGGILRPAARSQATAVSTPQAMVVFGGVVIPNMFYLSPVDLNDVWKFDYDSHTWQAVAVAVNSTLPNTRFSHAATTVRLKGVQYMVVFSGRHIFDTRWTILGDAWMLPLTSGDVLPSWTRLTANRPFGRILAGVVAHGSYMWLFGGFAFDTQAKDRGVAFADTLATDISSLPAVTLVGDSPQNQDQNTDTLSDEDGPSARFGHRMSVWNGNVVVYGGRYTQCLGDLWLRNASVEPRGASSDGREGPQLMQVTAALLALTLVLLILSACLLILLLVIKRNRRRQSRVMDATASPNGARPRGLSADEIGQFKLVPFEPSASIASTDEICPICLVEFVAAEALRQLPCQHQFHAECIGEWLERNLTCPMCKRDLSPTAATPAGAAATSTPEPPPQPAAASGVVVPLPGSIETD